MTILRSRFFWRLAAGLAAVVFVGAALIGLVLERRIEGQLRGDLELHLDRVCELAAPLARPALEAGVVGGGSAELREIGRRTGLRLTWILPDGTVIADSEADARDMENHGKRPEVEQALEAGRGRIRRLSRTVGSRLLFSAHRVDGERGPLGVVRGAVPLTEIDAGLAQLRRTVVASAGIGALVAFLLGLLAARRITLPIAELTHTAGELTAGNYDARARHLPRDELGLLGAALNRLAGEVSRRLAGLREEQARLRAMLAGLVEGVVAVDEQDRVLFCNAAAAALFGERADELEGELLWERVRIAELGRLLQQARASARIVRGELSLHRPEGQRDLDVHASPFSGGGASGVVAVLHDVSELKRLERIRRDFVANVSHELKTPLTSIRGFVELLLDGALHDDENNERFLRKIDLHVGRLTHLVADLLSLARIEAQGEQMAVESVDLGSLLAEVARRHEAGLSQRRQEFALEAPPAGERVVVRGEREALAQVADNLLDNAIKYTPERGRVVLRYGRAEGRAFFEVQDSGIGISEADLERIFERFYRVDKARSRAVGGTGLGLAIVRHLVAALRGEVEVESTPGVGSRFRVLLPLQR